MILFNSNICAAPYISWKVIMVNIHLVVHSLLFGASLVAQRVKHLPAMWETWVQFLGWEDSLEKAMATRSRIPAWRILWTEEPGGLQSMRL